MTRYIVAAPIEAELIDFCVHLQKQHTDALGFIPRSRFEYYRSRGQLLIAYEGGDACGYAAIGGCRRLGRIYQCVVAEDSQRMKHGTELVRAAEEIMQLRRYDTVTCRCAVDLPATAFWHTIGYEPVAAVNGGTRRQRKLIIYERPLLPMMVDPPFRRTW